MDRLRVVLPDGPGGLGLLLLVFRLFHRPHVYEQRVPLHVGLVRVWRVALVQVAVLKCHGSDLWGWGGPAVRLDPLTPLLETLRRRLNSHHIQRQREETQTMEPEPEYTMSLISAIYL